MKTRIIFIASLLIIWVIASYFAIDFTGDTKDVLTLIFVSLGGYGVIAATFLNIWNAWDSTKHLSDKMEFDRTENSFKYFERWDNQSLKEARDLTRQIKKDINNWSDDELLKKIKNCESTERSIITMFNFWEEIYKSIVANRVDAELLKISFSEVYCDMYIRFKVWREDKKSNGSENITKSLDALNKLWV